MYMTVRNMVMLHSLVNAMDSGKSDKTMGGEGEGGGG